MAKINNAFLESLRLEGSKASTIAKAKWLVVFLLVTICLKLFIGVVFVAAGIPSFERTVFLPISIAIINIEQIIISPVVEELTWRLPLKYHLNFIRLSVIMLLIDFLFYYELSYYFSSLGDYFDLRLIVFIAAIIFLLIILSKKSMAEQVSRFWSKNFVLIFYVLAFLFGIAHLRKFSIDIFSTYLPFIIVAGYTLVGLFYSYVRVKVGFLYAVIVHIFYNSMLLLYDFFVY